MERKRGEDKPSEHEVHWFSSPFLGLINNVLHTASCWSINYYEQRGEAKVLNTCMKYF
jgi:hypothetical protein